MASGRDLSLEFEDWPPVPELQIQAAPQPCDVFLSGITDQVKSADIRKMVAAQMHMLSRFEKTNEMLSNFNQLSHSRHSTTCEDFVRHTQLLTDMKQDLDSIFKRIRILKGKLAKQHPQAFKACLQHHFVPEDEEISQNTENSSAAISEPSESNTTPRHSAIDNKQVKSNNQHPAS